MGWQHLAETAERASRRRPKWVRPTGIMDSRPSQASTNPDTSPWHYAVTVPLYQVEEIVRTHALQQTHDFNSRVISDLSGLSLMRVTHIMMYLHWPRRFVSAGNTSQWLACPVSVGP